MKTSLMAGASRFAHFAGLSRASKRTDDDDQRDEMSEDDNDKDAEDDDEEQPEGKRSRRAKRSEDDDDGKDADDDDDSKDAADDDEEQPEGKRSRRAKRSDDDDDGKDAEDDDDKQEMTGRSAAASARRRERERVTAILSSSHAANNPVLAVSLACDTTMTRKEAIAVLKGQKGIGSAAPDRSSRESRNSNLGASAGGADQQKPKAGSSWDRSLAKLGITPRR